MKDISYSFIIMSLYSFENPKIWHYPNRPNPRKRPLEPLRPLPNIEQRR